MAGPASLRPGTTLPALARVIMLREAISETLICSLAKRIASGAIKSDKVLARWEILAYSQVIGKTARRKQEGDPDA
jgi:hypothetical protein